MSEEENEAIECIKQELIEPFYDFPNPTSIELKDTQVELLERAINLIEEQQKEIEDNKKFKKDIVDKIMIWDKEELPDNERIFSMLDTFVAEVSRLEDIEDKKVMVAIDFIEAKRDKFWKDKISKKIKEFEQIRNTIANEENQDLNYDMKRNDYCIKMLNELLEEK